MTMRERFVSFATRGKLWRFRVSKTEFKDIEFRTQTKIQGVVVQHARAHHDDGTIAEVTLRRAATEHLYF